MGLGISGGIMNGISAKINNRDFIKGELPNNLKSHPNTITPTDVRDKGLRMKKIEPLEKQMLKTESVFEVTPERVVFPKDIKYTIPSRYVDSPYNTRLPNSTAYGAIY